MYKRSGSDVGRRAWDILRLALLWARKGGIFALKKRLLQLDLSHFRPSTTKGLQDGDRQLSFDATPIIHVRMHRPNSMRFRLPHIPCINPKASDIFDDFDDESRSDCCYNHDHMSFYQQHAEEGIDLKAEEFIANFYHQLKLQRQISYLQ